jgi:predicted secreted Zn-dependent protease
MARLTQIVAAAVLLVVAGSARAAEVDQIAQHALIGVSGKALRACLGAPAERRAVGYEAIWTYPVGTLTADGPAFLFPLDLNLLHAGGVCDVRFVLGRYGVSQVYYTLPGGAPLPLGQLCNFPVEACAAR